MAGSAVIGALRVNLGIDTAAFTKGLASARKQLAAAGKSMQSVGKTMSVGLTAPIAAFGVSVLRTAGDFEAAMNRVGAVTGATGDQFDALRDTARQLGRDTQFSASEAAAGIEMLAKNGVSATDILGGVLKASLDLSAATGADLSGAADIATDAMAAFGKTASEMGAVVDGITGVTLASKFSIDDYKLAIAQGGGVAGAAGVSFEEFNAALAATSYLFASGSDAGTSLKNFINFLIPKSSSAAATMEKYGLAFYDASGAMKSMAEIGEVLRKGLGGLTEEARNEALHDIFGTDAMRTGVGLMKAGAEGIAKFEEQVKRASATEQAEARMKGFNGVMKQLKSVFEELKIAIGDSGLLEFVTDMAKRLTEFVRGLGETNPAILKWGTILAGVAAILGPVVLAIGGLAIAISAISLPVAAVIAAVVALGAAFVAFGGQIGSALSAAWQWISNTFGPPLTAIIEGAKAAFGSIVTKISEVVTGFIAKLVEMGENLWAAVQTMADDIVRAFEGLPERMKEVGRNIIQGLIDGINGLTGPGGALENTVFGVARRIKDRIESALGIQSPSRVMHEIGVYTMQGLQNGIQAGQAGAVAVAQDTAAKVSAAIAMVNGASSSGAWGEFKTSTDEATDGLRQMDSVGQTLGSTIGSAISGLISGTKKFKDVVADLLGKLADMFLNQGFQAITGALKGGGAGGGFLSGILSGLGGIFKSLPGFATGGQFKVGGSGGIDSQLVAFRASPDERVSITKPGQTGEGGGPLAISVNVNGANGDKHVIDLVKQGVRAGLQRYDQTVRGPSFLERAGDAQMRFS